MGEYVQTREITLHLFLQELYPFIEFFCEKAATAQRLHSHTVFIYLFIYLFVRSYIFPIQYQYYFSYCLFTEIGFGQPSTCSVMHTVRVLWRDCRKMILQGSIMRVLKPEVAMSRTPKRRKTDSKTLGSKRRI